MENTFTVAERPVILPDALIPEQRQDCLVQPGTKARWGEDLEAICSRPRPQSQQPAHGFAFVGGWLSFVGELSRS
jgi:hypothetical protein